MFQSWKCTELYRPDVEEKAPDPTSLTACQNPVPLKILHKATFQLHVLSIYEIHMNFILSYGSCPQDILIYMRKYCKTRNKIKK